MSLVSDPFDQRFDFEFGPAFSLEKMREGCKNLVRRVGKATNDKNEMLFGLESGYNPRPDYRAFADPRPAVEDERTPGPYLRTDSLYFVLPAKKSWASSSA